MKAVSALTNKCTVAFKDKANLKKEKPDRELREALRHLFPSKTKKYDEKDDESITPLSSSSFLNARLQAKPKSSTHRAIYDKTKRSYHINI